MLPQIEFDRFQGLLMGAIIGDAMGMPFQFLHPQVVREYFPKPVKSFVHAPPCHVNKDADLGQYTDETQLMTLIMEAVIETGRIQPEFVVGSLLQLHREGDLQTPGHSLTAACRHLEKGKDPEHCGVFRDTSKPLAFIPPLVLFPFQRQDDLLKQISSITRIISVEPRVLSGSICFSMLLKSILQCREEQDLPAAVEATAAYMETINQPFKEVLDWVLTLLDTDIDTGLEELGTGYSILESLSSSLFAFLKFPNDFGRAVSHIIYHGDSADTNGFLTGAFCGAFAGFSAIPDQLVEGLKDSQFFLDLVDGFFQKSGQSS